MLVDLRDKCGLGLKLDTEKPEIIFDGDLKASPPAIRTMDQMQDVLLDKDIKEPSELYFMYRDIYDLSDKSILEKHKLRYDVTMIKPLSLGREFMKTAGHYHPENFGELYEVVSGRCFCLLQRFHPAEFRIIEEVILVEAISGQKILIPPGFGHILINPGPDYLVTSNWVSSVFSSQYELYKRGGGAAYFVIASGETLDLTPSMKVGAKFIINKHFKQVADISFVRPAKRIERFGLAEGKPMYNLIKEVPRALDFLNHPLDYEYKDVFVR